MKTLICLILQVALGVQRIVAECPDALPGLTKWTEMSTVPSPSGAIEINEPILLDTETERLTHVVIGDGGRLVFDPTVTLAKLTSGKITIDDGGYLDIGSSDCPFSGNAEILLTGTRNDDQDNDPDFGNKFLGVKNGGSLEIHGPYKRSWTKLDGTLTPRPATFALGSNDQQPSRGINLYEFNKNDGTLIQEINNIRKMNRWLERKLDTLSADGESIVVVTKTSDVASDIYDQSVEFVELIESKLGVTGIALNTKWTDPLDAWVLVVDRSSGTFEETIVNFEEGDSSATAEGDTTIHDFHFKFTVKSAEDASGNRVYLRVMPNTEAEPYDQYTVTLTDDVGTWNVGDKLVIASTDFNMNQAEEVEVVSVAGNVLSFKGEIEFTHFGEIYEGVDMRAEVGLLSRNILIHGEMGEKCEPDELNDCEEFDYDNFGGHTRAIEGFKAYNIVGAEVTAMGQMTVLGSYPIHFHMCKDTSRGSIIEQNSIHHCFSRCVTVHGSHGVTLQDNVGYHTHGHCYFEEDGGEKDTTINGNLGLSTMKGLITPSDIEPSTFWITSPLTTFTNNAAAGSDYRKGSGIWYLFPSEPVGPSTGMGFFGKKEAKRTPITLFENNVAHSNGKIGLRFDKRLGLNHNILGCSTYDPKVDPKQKKSERVAITLNGFTGYKNKMYNAKMRSTTAELINFKLADGGRENMAFERNMLSGYQRLSNSVIIGESPNIGSGQWTTYQDEAGKWQRKWSDRSYARSRAPFKATGIYINAEGPTHIHNVTFRGFSGSTEIKYCGIEFKDSFKFGMGASSSVKDLDFGDMEDGNRICQNNLVFGADEPSMMLRDLDGTLTGTPGVSVTANTPYYHEGKECEVNSDWNMAVCDGNFARFYMWPKPENAGDTFLVKISDGTQDSSGKSRLVGYTVSPASRFILNSAEHKPITTIRFTGLESGTNYRLGICVPSGLKDDNIPLYTWVSMAGKWGKWKDLKNGDDQNGVVEADSLENLDSDDEKNAYFDREKGILYVKVVENDVRDIENGDLADCIGSLSVDNSCPAIILNLQVAQRMYPDAAIDLNDAICTER